MIIELLNGTRFDIENYGLKRLYHRIPSLIVKHNTQSVEGIGEVITHTQFENRTISVDLRYRVKDIYDFYLLRDELNGLFIRNEPFYIIFKKEPYKRYKVQLAKDFNLPVNRQIEKFTLEFITVNRFAESVSTTFDLKEWDVDLWGWNKALDWDSVYSYTFTENSFVVKNLGNVVVDPREHLMQIEVKGTFNEYVKITNVTTGEVYQYNGALSSTDTLVIDGIRSFKNDVSAFRDTNKKILTLALGDNQISVEGGTVDSIAFNFRFLFK